MPAGILITPELGSDNLVDDAVAQAKRAFALGVREVWLVQQFTYDAINLASIIGIAVPGLRVGTSVVPINPRHPLIIAAQAQTAQAACHGRFRLGLGLGGHEPERRGFGIAWQNPIERLREHLTILNSIFDCAAVDFKGAELSANPMWPVGVAGGTPIPIYVAAMGPRALQVTGELADGTIASLAGPRTIGEFIAPSINRAAAAAGHQAPRIFAGVAALMSTDVDAARSSAMDQLSFYETIPSYRRVLDREGVTYAGDLAAVGTEEDIARHLQAYLDAGATDVIINPLGGATPAELDRLYRLAAAL